MARADLLKKLFEAYQRRDDQAFRQAAAEVIEDERKKQHPVLANDLQRILANGVRSMEDVRGTRPAFDPVPMDSERRTPLLTVRTPDRYFDDLVLEPGNRAALDRVLTEVRGWEILDAHGLTPTRRLLLCGPSGCGKTASAEALAAELALPMLYVRFDSVVSSLLGETAANLRKVFDYAARGQWVVFFDEFDAIGRSRDDATEHGEIKRVVNSFLQLLDNFTGRSLVIAATNFEQSLDPAIWRRFDDVLRFGLPDAEALAALVSKRLRPLRFKKSHVDEIVAALKGASFADAERVCLDIRKQRALEGGDSVRAEDLRLAIERHGYRRDVLHRAAQCLHDLAALDGVLTHPGQILTTEELVDETLARKGVAVDRLHARALDGDSFAAADVRRLLDLVERLSRERLDANTHTHGSTSGEAPGLRSGEGSSPSSPRPLASPPSSSTPPAPEAAPGLSCSAAGSEGAMGRAR